MPERYGKLQFLTIKPTDICGYNCPYCSGRQALFGQSPKHHLSIVEWKTALQSASSLGIDSIRISGGEPTQYRELTQLVSLSRQFASRVQMFSNGHLLTAALAEQLVNNGLSGVTISLISLNPELHDSIRQTPESHSWAINACKVAVKSSLSLSVHVIVCRHNYLELPEFIRFFNELGATTLDLHYPENDKINRHLLMSNTDIEFLRSKVIPDCISQLTREGLGSIENIEALKGLYTSHSEAVDHSDGVYWSSSDSVGHCHIPLNFAMIYPNGDVLPCNAIEYTHEPIVGNIRRQPLEKIWRGPTFQKFRDSRTIWCKFCPMALHTRISFI